MVKSKKELTAAMSGQGSFLDKIEKEDPGLLNVSLRFRDALSQALKKCRDSRYQVAANMSELTSSDISKTMIDAYTADSKEYHRFPAEWLPAFARATGSIEPLIVVVEASDCQIITREEEVFVELARKQRQKDVLDREIEGLKRRIK